jgi:hypothetical protein
VSISRNRSVRTDWVPGKTPPTFHGTIDSTDADSMERWHDYVMDSVEFYPESVSMNLEGVTFTELRDWVATLTEKDLEWPNRTTRDLVEHLLGRK